MEFGKIPLSQIERIDFRLPADHAPSVMALSEVDRSVNVDPPKVYVGCPVWNEPRWVGSVYPARTKQADFFKAYTQQFNTIEFNGSFYRIPDPQTIQKWKQVSEAGFKLCPKVFQGISHEKQLVGAEDLTAQFCESLMDFGSALGPAFLQLPPYFARDRLGVLKKFLARIPVGIQVAVEFRHSSFFQRQELHPSVFELLEESHALAVITDVAGRRDLAHVAFPGGKLFVRFVGNDLHATDYSRIDAWVLRIHAWIQAGLREIYFFIHEPDNVLSPELARYLIRQMNQIAGLSIRNWVDQPVVESPHGEQLSLF